MAAELRVTRLAGIEGAFELCPGDTGSAQASGELWADRLGNPMVNGPLTNDKKRHQQSDRGYGSGDGPDYGERKDGRGEKDNEHNCQPAANFLAGLFEPLRLTGTETVDEIKIALGDGNLSFDLPGNSAQCLQQWRHPATPVASAKWR
jgi:hypothetical protein